MKPLGSCRWCGDPLKPPKNNKRRRCRLYCSNSCSAADRRTDPVPVILLYREGLTQRAIAQRLGMTRKTVHKTLERAGVSLRKRTITEKCIILGCGKPVFKRVFPSGNCGGRLCRWHFCLKISRMGRDRRAALRERSGNEMA